MFLKCGQIEFWRGGTSINYKSAVAVTAALLGWRIFSVHVHTCTHGVEIQGRSLVNGVRSEWWGTVVFCRTGSLWAWSRCTRTSAKTTLRRQSPSKTTHTFLHLPCAPSILAGELLRQVASMQLEVSGLSPWTRQTLNTIPNKQCISFFVYVFLWYKWKGLPVTITPILLLLL